MMAAGRGGETGGAAACCGGGVDARVEGAVEYEEAAEKSDGAETEPATERAGDMAVGGGERALVVGGEVPRGKSASALYRRPSTKSGEG